MKLSVTTVTLGLAALSAARPGPPSYLEPSKMIRENALARRQAGFADSLQSTFKDLVAAKAAKTVQVEPSGKRAGTKRTKFYFGPHSLPKKGEKAEGGIPLKFDPNSMTFANIVDFPGDITMLFTNHYLEYEDGTKANGSNGVYSHHTLYMDVTKGWKTAWGCPGPNGTAYPQITLMGTMNNQDESNSATTFSSPDGKFDSGFYVGKNDIVLSSGEVINYNDDAKKIYIVADIEYLPGKQQNFYDTSMQALFVSGCDWNNIGGAMNLKIPAGAKKHTFKSEEMIFTQDGYVMNMLGHLHDGGTNMTLNLHGETVCESKGVYAKGDGHSHGMLGMGGGGEASKGQAANATTTLGAGDDYEGLVAMTLCDKPIKVSKGDAFTIEASFDFEKYPGRVQIQGGNAEVMGMFAAMFAAKV